MNSCDLYSYRLIGKLSVFLQFQEFRYLDSIGVPSRLRLIRKSAVFVSRFHILTESVRIKV